MTALAVGEGVCRVGLPGARWLVTGPNGGYRGADAAYNVTVPEGFSRTDLAAYAAERREAAGFGTPGPALLTGVGMADARATRHDGVCALATVGLSNPVALGARPDGQEAAGTVNLLVGTDRALADGALATLLATVVEVKAATLQAATGFTGTTSDAVAVGTDLSGDPAAFAGGATAVGAATRACVRGAVGAALDTCTEVPASVAEADHGATATATPEPFAPGHN